MKHSASRKGVRGAITSLLVMACVVAASTGALAASKLIVQDNAATPNDKFVVTDMGFIGQGAPVPTFAYHMIGAGDPGLTAMFFHNKGRVAVQPGDSPGLNFFRNNESTVNGGLPRANDRLGYFAFGSVINGSNKYLSTVQSYAEGIWTNTSAPTYFTFGTTSTGTTNVSEKVRITASGNVGIGTAIPSQKLEVNGALRLNTVVKAPVTCDSTLRGVIWYTQGDPNVADSLAVCAKDGNNNYAWRQLY